MDNYNWKSTEVASPRLANFFEIAEGRNSWGPRLIEDFELILMVEGKGILDIAQRPPMAVSKGEVLLIPPNHCLHTFSCPTDTPATISCIHFSFTQPHDHAPPHVFASSHDTTLPLLFKECAKEFEKRREGYGVAMQLLLKLIWVRLLRANTPQDVIHPAKIQQALHYIELHYAERLERDTVAAWLDCTPEYLSTLFQKHLGQTFTETITAIRIRKACALLHKPNMNISQTSFMCGFEDPLYFSRVFSKKMGISPKKYATRL